jgi:hypothetical protein
LAAPINSDANTGPHNPLSPVATVLAIRCVVSPFVTSAVRVPRSRNQRKVAMASSKATHESR